MIFVHDKKWVEDVNRSVRQRILLEAIILVLFVATVIVSWNIFALVGAVLIFILLVSDMYWLPKRIELQNSYSVEVLDSGLCIKNKMHKPLYIDWGNICIISRAEKNGKLVSLTLEEGTGIGKIILEGIENIEILETKIKERKNAL